MHFWGGENGCPRLGLLEVFDPPECFDAVSDVGGDRTELGIKGDLVIEKTVELGIDLSFVRTKLAVYDR